MTEKASRSEDLDDLAGRVRDAVPEQPSTPQTEVPRKASTRDLNGVEEIDHIAPADDEATE